MTAQPRRRFLSFSLRALLLLMFAIAVPLGLFGRKLTTAWQQRTAVAALLEMGCSVEYEQDTAGNKSSIAVEWLGSLLGEDLSAIVITVDGANSAIADAGLAHLRGVPHLRNLILFRSEVTDAGLAHLERLYQLEHLDLDGAQVTDAGLLHLRELSHLTYLNLHSSRVTDAGLPHLGGLQQLMRLNLTATQVTDAGALELQQVLPTLEIIR